MDAATLERDAVQRALHGDAAVDAVLGEDGAREHGEAWKRGARVTLDEDVQRDRRHAARSSLRNT
jgi:hypothetical protein